MPNEPTMLDNLAALENATRDGLTGRSVTTITSYGEGLKRAGAALRGEFPVPQTRTDRIAALRQEMRELGVGMLDDALSSAEALVQKLRELAEAPSDAVSDGQRDAAGKLASSLDSSVTTMRQIQARTGQ